MCKPKTYSLINKSALVSNYKTIKSKLPDGCRLMCVVKADCYGHGADCIKDLNDAGADCFAVSSLQEAIQARNYTDKDILILSYTHVCDTEQIIKGNFIQTVYCSEYAAMLSNAIPNGKKVRVHIKIDTGMNRIGFHHDDENAIADVINNEKFNVEGVFTHFAKGDEADKTANEKQLERFLNIKNKITEISSKPIIFHCANSGALLDFPQSHFQMARCGIALYGVCPSNEVRVSGLIPVMQFCTTVVNIHTIQKGEEVSYGGQFKAEKATVVATLCCGYGDGIPRAFSGGEVEINGTPCRVIGRICMDHMMVDVTHFKKLPKIGDTAVVFGDVEKYANHIGTIPYECLCMVGKRVKRISE